MFLLREILVKAPKTSSGGGGGDAPKATNFVVEVLSTNYENVIDYLFLESFCNIRAALKLNNQLEIDNVPSNFNLECFFAHFKTGNLAMLKKLYRCLVDLMQLPDVAELFKGGVQLWQSPKQSGGRSSSSVAVFLIEFILKDPKFLSLFATSFERQKCQFIRELLKLNDSYPKFGILETIYSNIHYHPYVELVMKGQGDELLLQ